jgi:C-terminal processing protease CtpA/Prc
MGNSTESERKDLQISGYQVVRVIPDSPASKAGLVPYFDFIIGLDNCPLQEEKSEFFSNYVNQSENQPLQITVYSTKLMKTRSL